MVCSVEYHTADLAVLGNWALCAQQCFPPLHPKDLGVDAQNLNGILGLAGSFIENGIAQPITLGQFTMVAHAWLHQAVGVADENWKLRQQPENPQNVVDYLVIAVIVTAVVALTCLQLTSQIMAPPSRSTRPM